MTGGLLAAGECNHPDCQQENCTQNGVSHARGLLVGLDPVTAGLSRLVMVQRVAAVDIPLNASFCMPVPVAAM